MKKVLNVSFEIKAIDEKGVFSGYGSVFGNIDAGRDMVMPGAFAKTLAQHAETGSMPLMFYSHNAGKENGEWLEMHEDEKGLFCKGQLWIDGENPDPDALKAYRGMKKKGSKMGLSIGYMIAKDGAEYVKGEDYWKLKELELYEVSVTPMPMNGLATVENVKAADEIVTVRDFEGFLRDSGFTSRAAVSIASKGFTQRESADADELVEAKIQDVIGAIKRVWSE